jgi:hypothetical protein
MSTDGYIPRNGAKGIQSHLLQERENSWLSFLLGAVLASSRFTRFFWQDDMLWTFVRMVQPEFRVQA